MGMSGPTYNPATNTTTTVIVSGGGSGATKAKKAPAAKKAPPAFVYKAPKASSGKGGASPGMVPSFVPSEATGYGEASLATPPPPSYAIPKAGPHATTSQIASAIRRGQAQEDLLKQQLAYDSKHNRLPTATEKNLITKRIYQTEDALQRLYADYLRQNKVMPLDLVTFNQQTQTAQGGLLVIVDISSDCVAFSNPGPTFKKGMDCYVRCQINNAAAAAPGEVPISRDLIRVYWTVPKEAIFYPQDTVSPGGRDEYFVSYPLTITRWFKVKGTPTNKETFKVNVEVYTDAGDGP